MSESALLISSRTRVVWTREEKRLIDRVAKVFNAHGDVVLLRCGSPVCPEHAITLHQDDSNPGGRILRCGCTDRIFSPGLPRPIRH